MIGWNWEIGMRNAECGMKVQKNFHHGATRKVTGKKRKEKFILPATLGGDKRTKEKYNWDTDKDGLTRINKNTIWLAFGDKEHISGLLPYVHQDVSPPQAI